MSLTFKRHYRLLVLLALILTILTLGLGNQRIVAYTVPGSLSVMDSTIEYANSIHLFDDSLVHSIQIMISDEDYQKMITTYQQTGEKDYFHADVIIDGVQVNDVGLRLKGNASLRAALGGTGGAGLFARRQALDAERALPQFDSPVMPGGDVVIPQFDPENMSDFGERGAPSSGRLPPDGALPQQHEEAIFQPRAAGGGTGQNTQIPVLIKFDEFVSGQTYQGYSRLAIRSAGASYDASMLQEPLTNYVFRLAGLPATQTAYAGVQLNDEDEQLFTISEIIDETYLEGYFENPDGVLYKAELNATMTYQGEDPSAYANSFTQETRQNNADFAPLIAFLRFLSESDEATFANELPDYLDVESFAAYLASNNLLVNTDSMAGMGNNFYFYYDDLMGYMTVLMWDGNESLGKLNGSANYDLYFQGGSGMGRGGRMGGGTNQLITRFLANESFKALYEQELKQIYAQAFQSGAIAEQIDAYAALIRQANQARELVDEDAYEAAVTAVLDFISQRSAYLSSTALLGESANLTE
jgi:spore coat protein CotH